MGSKNHEIVPTALIIQISGLRNGGVNKNLGELAKRNLVARVRNAKYDGYRLTYGGYDYLAMRTLSKRGTVHSVGNQIGVGKESDIYIVADSEANEMVLKLHRLGRVSFRTIKQNRDYMGKRKSASWMYMSRLAAQKEWAFMKVSSANSPRCGRFKMFPPLGPPRTRVPRAAADRPVETHPTDGVYRCLSSVRKLFPQTLFVLKFVIDELHSRQISEVASPGKLYSTLMDLIIRFAKSGLIHGDFNEFNILIRRSTGEPVVIDFPQMVSTSHANAEWYFNRDVECIRTFFRRRFRYESNLYPRFRSTTRKKDGEGGAKESDGEDFRLDVVVAASGFRHSEQKVLEEYMEAVREEGDREFSHSEEEEEGDLSNDEETVSSGGDAVEVGDGSEPNASAECHRLDGTVRQSHLDHGGREETAIKRLSFGDELGEGSRRSSTGSEVPSAARNIPVETELRSLEISEGEPPKKGLHVDRGGKVEGADLESDQALSDDSGDDEECTERHVTSSSIKEKVATEIIKDKNRQRKYHTKKSAQRSKGGKVKGSKAKSNVKQQVAGADWF